MQIIYASIRMLVYIHPKPPAIRVLACIYTRSMHRPRRPHRFARLRRRGLRTEFLFELFRDGVRAPCTELRIIKMSTPTRSSCRWCPTAHPPLAPP